MNSPRQYTLNDILYAAQHSPNFNYQFWFTILTQIIMNEIFKYLGYLLVLIAVLIITALGYSGIVYILPYYSNTWSLLYIFNLFTGIFILFNIYYNYFKAITTDPGTPDKSIFSIENDESVHISEKYKQCKKCNVIKPPRAHHCSMCERCTLRMDHHCPWINNCVGLNNYRFFVLFLFWTTFGTLYLTLLSTAPVISILKTELIGSYSQSSNSKNTNEGWMNIFSFTNNSNDNDTTTNNINNNNTTLPQPKRGLSGLYEFYQFVSILTTVPDDKLKDYKSKGLEINKNTLETLINKEKEEKEEEKRQEKQESRQLNKKVENYSNLKLEDTLSQDEINKFSNEGSYRRLIERNIESSSDVNSRGSFPSLRGSVNNNQQNEKTGNSNINSFNIFFLFFRPRLLSDVINGLDVHSFPFVVTFLTAFAVHMAVLMLFIFHLYLVVTGQTTIEFYMNMNKRAQNNSTQSTQSSSNVTSTPQRNVPPHYGHPYDRGYENNIKEIFGPFPWYVAILPFVYYPEPSVSSGIEFGRTRRRADTGYGSLTDV